MEELQKIVHLDQGNKLVQRLKLAGYSFATWRMPHGKTTQLIISLKQASQPSDFQLSRTDPGFIINKYDNNHPIEPFYISADIIVEENNVRLNPNVRSSEIDDFIVKINAFKKENRPSVEVKSTSNNYEEIVADAIDQIKAGTFEKVVPSRFKDVPIPDSFSEWDFYQSICDKYKNAFCSLTCIEGADLWIGATPELLLSDNEKRFKTTSLAGTKSLEDGQNLSEIAWTQKEIEEQAFVSRYIVNCFKKIRLREFHEQGPKTVKAGSLAHLKTEFIVDYDEFSFDELPDQMLELLHPTSAVCGMPVANAKKWIKENEKYDREFYTGFLGPVNINKSTDLFVNLRCMKVSKNSIRFYAGAGVTEDSIPSKELKETELKMSVMNRLI